MNVPNACPFGVQWPTGKSPKFLLIATASSFSGVSFALIRQRDTFGGRVFLSVSQKSDARPRSPRLIIPTSVVVMKTASAGSTCLTLGSGAETLSSRPNGQIVS